MPSVMRPAPVLGVAGATALVVVLASAAWSATAGGTTPSGTAVLTARPPAAADGDGVVARVEAVVATVDGVVADVIARTAGEDGALEQEGEADFVLAGDVYFDSGSFELLPRATADLQGVAAQVRQAGVTALLVVGHTDTVGSDASNQVLSENRAAAVVAALQPQLPEVAFTSEGRGETELVAAETTEDGQDDPAGRALNRRVTISPAD